jgi:hypothetical protein
MGGFEIMLAHEMREVIEHAARKNHANCHHGCEHHGQYMHFKPTSTVKEPLEEDAIDRKKQVNAPPMPTLSHVLRLSSTSDGHQTRNHFRAQQDQDG